MDKLQPILRHHFWILAGLILPMAMYGYYSANGQLKAATKARETALEGVKSGVKSGDNEPNQDYIDKLSHINKNLAEWVDDEAVEVWRRQQARMTWPQQVAAFVPKEFLGEFPKNALFIYKPIYPNLVRELLERVQPVRPLDPMARPGAVTSASATRNQKVILAANVPQASFGQFGITSQEMWDAQIDIWLTELLFDAIVRINDEKESVTEAVVRRIDDIRLVGGTGTPTTRDSGGGGGGGDPGMGGGMPGGGMGGATASSTIGFPPEEEFGPASEGGGGMSSDGSGAPAAANMKRYINESDGAPYLERGFYMTVIIQQSKIGDFVVELANCPWPTRVVRFQMGANPYNTGKPGAPNRGYNPMSDYGSSSAFSSPAAETSGSFPDSSGGFGGGMPRTATVGNPFASNLPEFATAALQHPDLVRLDLCGVITMYRPPREALEAVEKRKAEQAAAAAAAATVPATAPAPAEAPAADPAAPAAAPAPENGEPARPEGGAPASPGEAAPAAAPATAAESSPASASAPAIEGAAPAAPPQQ